MFIVVPGLSFHLHGVISVLYRLELFFPYLTEIYWPKTVSKMHIKSIILEGFKSYAQRTEVNGFDPLFNAITGLNGSGKSNILDSICFLLGISNLSQVKCKLPDFCD
jgi:predicted ATPase